MQEEKAAAFLDVNFKEELSAIMQCKLTLTPYHTVNPLCDRSRVQGFLRSRVFCNKFRSASSSPSYHKWHDCCKIPYARISTPECPLNAQAQVQLCKYVKTKPLAFEETPHSSHSVALLNQLLSTACQAQTQQTHPLHLCPCSCPERRGAWYLGRRWPSVKSLSATVHQPKKSPSNPNHLPLKH